MGPSVVWYAGEDPEVEEEGAHRVGLVGNFLSLDNMKVFLRPSETTITMQNV